MRASKRRIALALLLCLTALTLRTAWAQTAVYWGSRGQLVTQVQQKLQKWGYLKAAADGVFGKDTYDAVVLFQRKNGLEADGVAGEATLAALGISTAEQASAVRNTDVDLLARLVYGEARGEPYLGQVAVAAVVLNRVAHASFPNTVSGVIYQSGAFDAVSDGQINLAPDAQALRAAQDALNGWDPTGGCIYYYNPGRATSSWIYSRTVMTVIGKHYFAK